MTSRMAKPMKKPMRSGLSDVLKRVGASGGKPSSKPYKATQDNTMRDKYPPAGAGKK